jgi:hypothetical protein
MDWVAEPDPDRGDVDGHTRLLRADLAEMHGPPILTKLRAAARAYENAITELTRQAGLAE